MQLPEGVFSKGPIMRLRIEARHNRFRILVDDRLVRELYDTTLSSPGIFGLSITSHSLPDSVCFDNFRVFATN